MLRTIFILLIRLFRILFFLLLCLINSFFGTFEKTQLQIERFLEHLAKWHCVMPPWGHAPFFAGIWHVMSPLYQSQCP